MSQKFQIGDCVKLVNMVYPYIDYESMEGIVTYVGLTQTLYSSFYTYTVSVDRVGIIDTIDMVLESNLELVVAAEPMDIWPPPCICATFQLATAGCDCGAMKKEREMREKGLVPND